MIPPQPYAETLLLVDDTPANLQLLAGLLKEKGYRVRAVQSGEQAVKAVGAAPPDLILMDVTMPGMDGYQTTAKIRETEAFRDIPILFVSALNETVDKVRAFSSGGVDYVTKPFRFEEVEARVRTHLDLRDQKRRLAAALERQRRLEVLRDDLTHMIAHDMKSPLMVINLSIEMAMGGASPDDRETLKGASSGVAQLLSLVNQMLDVSKLEAGELRPERCEGRIADVVAAALSAVVPPGGKVQVAQEGEAGLTALMDAELVRRVIENLVGNALKFSPAGGVVTVAWRPEPGGVRIEVRDGGPGLPEAQRERIFEKFAQVEGPMARKGTGLGLTFCRMVAEAHGGRIGVEPAPDRGSVFWFTLPGES